MGFILGIHSEGTQNPQVKSREATEGTCMVGGRLAVEQSRLGGKVS